jgi:uncharacterized protein YlxP (DUF503 family)
LQSTPEDPRETASDLPESAEPQGNNEWNAPEMAELDKLKRLICSPGKNLYVKPGARYPRTLRPVNDHTDDILTRVAVKMQATIRHAGEGPTDALLESKLKGLYHLGQPLRPEHAFKSVGGILYDQEWTGNPSQGMIPDHTTLENTDLDVKPACIYAFEMMLLVDYGFPPCPVRFPWVYPRQAFLDLYWTPFESFSHFLTAVACRWKEGQLPDPVAWEYIARKMEPFDRNGLDVCDAATLIYYYHTRREPVDNESTKWGWTGYTGVLQEMINEVPTRGTDRLARKLSLDINLLIPKYVSDREKRELMLYKARRLVQEYNLSVSDTGSQEKRGWLETIANWFSLDEEETVAEKEKEL